MNDTTTITTTVDSRWDATSLPRAFDSELVLSAWSSDVELDEQVAETGHVYGADTCDLYDLLQAVRSYLREAVLDAETATSEAAAVVSNMAHLINGHTTDGELDLLTASAEAGAGGPIPGLLEELRRLRDTRQGRWVDPTDPFCPTALRGEGRVFVGYPGAPHIANLGDPVIEIEDDVAPGECGCRFAHRGERS